MPVAAWAGVNRRLIRSVPGIDTGPGRDRYHIPIDPTRRAEFPVSSSPQTIRIYSTAICPYCVAAKNFLKSQGRQWTEIRVDLDPVERDKMVGLARRTSVPQIFVGDVHVGGYDDMMAMHRAGRLLPLLDGLAPSA
ncbi:glutaredoxin 3 [Pseudoxanthomonas broegbernensis]|uniref:Glutaredoxin n=1 Tax=Pseudoxanthomonas broegbernensis TaxID=83619 RepID=A0A7V8K7Y8_9GAMM|nr:glutaredoxin 3 [Pseudoxanthomonas broegbernensis]